MVKTLSVKKLISDSKMSSLEGDYIDDSYILFLVDKNIDIYKETGELLLSFRKNVIKKKTCNLAYNSFKKAANRTSYARGTAAGPIDIDKLPKSVAKLRPMDKTEKGVNNTKNWTYYYKKNGEKAKDQISNGVNSGIMGYYEKFRGLPCRMTSYTKQHEQQFIDGIPFIQEINKKFRELVPDKYYTQLERAQNTDFVIADTAFSTFTINKNFQTGIHKDAGDFKEGFGNLSVLEKGDYTGGYTVFPQYGIGVDVREGDFLAMDVHEWHANTPIKLLNKEAERISIICYLRNSIFNLCR